MLADSGADAERFHPDDLHRVVEEGDEHPDRVASPAHAGSHHIGINTGHLQKLLPRLAADNGLKIPHHHREGMRPERRADAVNRVLIFPGIGGEGGIHRLLQGFQPMRDRHHLRAENLHPGHVGGLLGNIHLAHMNLAFQPEVGGRRGQRHAVLSRAGFGDQLLLSHVFGEKPFPHAVVELVRAGMVEVLPFEINLAGSVPHPAGKPLAVVNRGRTPLKFPPDAAKFRNKLGGMTDGLIRSGNFLKSGFQLLAEITAAVLAETAVFIRKSPGIIAIILIFHFCFSVPFR